MNRREAKPLSASGFRVRLLAAMMIVVAAFAVVALYVAERRLVAGVESNLDQAFESEIGLWQKVREIRQTALEERVRILVRKSRLASALEPADDAIDLLYEVADLEMRGVMETPPERGVPTELGLRAEFYRFLDRSGRVIPIPPNDQERFGLLSPEEERALELPAMPATQQIGYLVRTGGMGGEELVEIIARPIISIDSDEVIAAIVVGFQTLPLATTPETGMLRGLWRDGRIHAPAIPRESREAFDAVVSRDIAAGGGDRRNFRGEVAGVPHLIFHQRLNPGSSYPAASEVLLYPLARLETQQRALRWQVAGAGALLLFGAFWASHYLSGRLARVVTELAESSAEDRAQRHRAEAELQLRQEELERAARFSADASHQLKTPVAVLRAGLEELLHRENHSPKEAEEMSALVQQTFRLSGIIEDLLLLSRIDAGRLTLVPVPVNLNELVEAGLDDVGAMPGAAELSVEKELSAEPTVLGERRYLALIIQNLLENAWKYNRPGGRIRVTTRQEGRLIELVVANTGRPVAPAAGERIFERFNRGGVGENVPGYGLGLNLARELTRLHGGDLRLRRSDDEWTEFELRLRAG